MVLATPLPLVRRRRHRVAVFAVLAGAVAVVGCPADLKVAPPPPATPETPATPVTPGSCAALTPASIPLLPRTSNHEMQQLVSDLLGTPVDPALFVRWTPLAQVRGFDTMTESRIDAQTLDEQFTTTAAVAAQLVNAPAVMAVCPTPTDLPPLCPLQPTYDATAQFSGVQGQDCWSYLDGAGTALTFDVANQFWTASDPGLFIWNTGLHPGIGIDVIRRFTAPADGSLTLRGSFADADGGGGDGIVVEIRARTGNVSGVVFRAVIVNGGAAEAFEVPLDVRRGDFIDVVVQRGADNAYDSTALSASVAFVAAPPSGGLSWENCGLPVVERLAARAWRRPLRSEELADLKTVFDETSVSAQTAGLPSFHEGLQATLQAALLSPHVQYKPEFVPGGFAPAEDGFRRASRLALFFRSSFADDELWGLATAGGLDDDAVLRAQAERLLAREGSRFVDNFAGQWLDFRAPIGANDTPLGTSMRNEAHDVFAAVLDEDLPPERLIEPGFTIVDAALAAHYGLPAGDESAGPARISTSERGGLFTQGHFLTSSARGSEFQRVIHRGIFTLNRMLCTSVPMLDPATREEIASSVGQIDPALPLGDRMQAHRNTSERCLSCHSQMDPLGLALEHFDTEGRWRDAYPDGSAIDNGFDFNDTPVHDPAELATFVAGSDDFQRCVAEKLFTYGLHRAVRSEETCVVDGLAASGSSLHDVAVEAFLSSLRLTEQP